MNRAGGGTGGVQKILPSVVRPVESFEHDGQRIVSQAAPLGLDRRIALLMPRFYGLLSPNNAKNAKNAKNARATVTLPEALAAVHSSPTVQVGLVSRGWSWGPGLSK